MLFFTSDLHFDHANVLKFCPNSREIPFPEGGTWGQKQNAVAKMNELLIERWNSKVSEQDITYLLGDISFGRTDQAIKYLARLNGKKVIVWGNHDNKLRDSSQYSMYYGNSNIYSDQDYLEVNLRGTDFILFHYPIKFWNKCHHGSIHLYGHLHGSGPISPYKTMDIGVDTNHLYPYSLDEVFEIMETREIKKPSGAD